MQVSRSVIAGPERDILGLELMLEGIEILLEKKKANGIMFGSSFILSEIFILSSDKSSDFNSNFSLQLTELLAPS